jgi:hypothetical protein
MITPSLDEAVILAFIVGISTASYVVSRIAEFYVFCDVVRR